MVDYGSGGEWASDNGANTNDAVVMEHVGSLGIASGTETSAGASAITGANNATGASLSVNDAPRARKNDSDSSRASEVPSDTISAMVMTRSQSSELRQNQQSQKKRSST